MIILSKSEPAVVKVASASPNRKIKEKNRIYCICGAVTNLKQKGNVVYGECPK